ncbi:MAG: hypothetical protein AAF670_10700, partial [Planctomycetota bacterium]
MVDSIQLGSINADWLTSKAIGERKRGRYLRPNRNHFRFTWLPGWTFSDVVSVFGDESLADDRVDVGLVVAMG